ncbi:MAG: hypothetical protein ACTSX8_06050 [Alphaproteobacteria bacterium]
MSEKKPITPPNTLRNARRPIHSSEVKMAQIDGALGALDLTPADWANVAIVALSEALDQSSDPYTSGERWRFTRVRLEQQMRSILHHAGYVEDGSGLLAERESIDAMRWEASQC